MSKKKLDTSIISEQLEQEKFAVARFAGPVRVSPTPNERLTKPKKKQSIKESKHASTIASEHDSMIESIRKVVKSTGKEVAYVRLTEEEKSQLADIVYTYKRQKVKTSENELIRIAVNSMLEEYQANGKESTLAKVIDRLIA